MRLTIFVYGTVQFKKEKTTRVKLFCLFTDGYDLVELSAISCSVSVWGQIRVRGRVCGDVDCCMVAEEALPLLSRFPALTALPKHLAWRGEGTETPVPTMWPSIFFLLSLSYLG